MFNGHLENQCGARNKVPQRPEKDLLQGVEKEFFGFSQDGSLDAPVNEKTKAVPVRGLLENSKLLLYAQYNPKFRPKNGFTLYVQVESNTPAYQAGTT